MASGLRPAWLPKRGPSSRELLTIDWQFPVYAPKTTKSRRGTTATAERKSLPVEMAFNELAGNDPRPLLVLRECFACSGTDDALLSRTADNERTVLLSKWFHCVKLPPDVLEENHPFRALFSEKDPAHLFVAHRDGTELAELKGDQSRRELWKVMEARLGEEYEGRPASSVKGLFRLLDRYDLLDEKQGLLEAQLEEEIEDRGPKSSKVKKRRKKIEKLKAEREKLVKDWKKDSTLVLIQSKAADGSDSTG